MSPPVTWDHFLPAIRIPNPDEKIFKDECPFHFETAEQGEGLYICLKHYIGIGASALKKYAEATGSRVFLQYRIKRQYKHRDPSAHDLHPTKLALGVPGGFELPQDRYTVTEHWALVLLPQQERVELPCPIEGSALMDTSHLLPLGMPEPLARTVSLVQHAQSALLLEERSRGVQAWEDENLRPVSSHALDLKQLDNGVRIAPSGWKCSSCDMKENLWLNLTDGSINCGRRFWDGSGGNNHAIEHYERTGYPLAVKLGTITAQGAEVFSYAEDDMVDDPLLAEHLAHFGIDILRMQKTDKTVAELEISANERLGEWQLLQESDRSLEPRYGPGLTGLRNLGNTCYMNAVVQTLFAIPQFRWLYAYQLPYWLEKALQDLKCPQPSLPIDHIGLQFAKLGHGLCSGAHSWLVPENYEELHEGPVPLLPGIRPQLFRRLMGLHNANFRTKQQQDAYEFLLYILDLLDTKAADRPNTLMDAHGRPVNVPSPSSCLRFSIEDRLECGLTNKVRYTTREDVCLSLPVPLAEMTNKQEYDAFEAQRQEVEASGVKLSPDDVVRPRIPFEACLSSWSNTEVVEDFSTPASNPPGAKTHALRSSRLANFPDYLCVQLSKFTVGSDWIPRKLDVEIELPAADAQGAIRIDLSRLRAKGGLQPGESPMPDSESVAAPPSTAFVPDDTVLQELLAMGFPVNACRRACKETNNTGLESATMWIMEHMEDADFDAPLVESTPTVGFSPNEESVVMLTSMGFTKEQAARALRETNNDLQAAADWAFSNPDLLDAPMDTSTNPPVTGDSAAVPQSTANNSTPLTDGSPIYELCAFISHMGRSTTDGHYVAHIKRSSLAKSIPGESSTASPRATCGGTDREWIIFNDEKVAKSEAPPHPFAYLYLFRRIDSPAD